LSSDVNECEPLGMGRLAECYYNGRGVRQDSAQAAVWYEKAVSLGDAASKSNFGVMLINGDPSAGVAIDAARGFALVRQAFDQGIKPALMQIAVCYLYGTGVVKDSVHAVSLLRQVIAHDAQDDTSKADAQTALAL